MQGCNNGKIYVISQFFGGFWSQGAIRSKFLREIASGKFFKH